MGFRIPWTYDILSPTLAGVPCSMSPALSAVAGSYSHNLSWLVMLGLMSTLTEVTSSTACAICIAWWCEARAMVKNKAGKEESLVHVGSLADDLKEQIHLVIFSI